MHKKTLTLDYNFPNNDFFDLIVIDIKTVELFQISPGDTYQFKARRYIPSRTSEENKDKDTPKYRKKTLKKYKSA